MKGLLEKILKIFFESSLEKDKDLLNNEDDDEDRYIRDRLDDYDDWTEDEAEDLLDGGKKNDCGIINLLYQT